MYTEEDYEEKEYEERGFSLKKVLLRFLIIVIIIILVIYLMVKVIMPRLDHKKSTNNEASSNKITETNYNNIKTSIFNYYNDKDLPSEEKMSIRQLIDKGIIATPKEDKDNKLDYDNSYIEITKIDDDYSLKINLKTALDEKYYTIYFGHYEYCEENKLCEKDDSKITSSETEKEESKDNDDNDYDENTPIKQSVEDAEKQEKEKQDQQQEKTTTLYRYEKTTPVKLSEWSKWSDWAKTTCTLSDISCDNNDENCLLELKIKRESNGTICYKSLRKRTKISSSYTTTRWSKYNDEELLNNGWKYTGETKENK